MKKLLNLLLVPLCLAISSCSQIEESMKRKLDTPALSYSGYDPSTNTLTWLYNPYNISGYEVEVDGSLYDTVRYATVKFQFDEEKDFEVRVRTLAQPNSETYKDSDWSNKLKLHYTLDTGEMDVEKCVSYESSTKTVTYDFSKLHRTISYVNAFGLLNMIKTGSSCEVELPTSYQENEVLKYHFKGRQNFDSDYYDPFEGCFCVGGLDRTNVEIILENFNIALASGVTNRVGIEGNVDNLTVTFIGNNYIYGGIINSYGSLTIFRGCR